MVCAAVRSCAEPATSTAASACVHSGVILGRSQATRVSVESSAASDPLSSATDWTRRFVTVTTRVTTLAVGPVS